METTKVKELVKSMQEMFKDVNANGESDKYLFFSPNYSPKVKVSEWFLPLEAEPKDNNPYSPPGGDYFLSTYKQLGTEEDTELESETHAMLRQVCCVHPVRSHHMPLINWDTDLLLRAVFKGRVQAIQARHDLDSRIARFVTSCCVCWCNHATAISSRHRIIPKRKETPLVSSYQHLFGQNDFTTTYEYDYRHPYPYKKSARLELGKKPEKVFKLSSIFSPSKICETKFLDDKFYSGRHSICPKLDTNVTTSSASKCH